MEQENLSVVWVMFIATAIAFTAAVWTFAASWILRMIYRLLHIRRCVVPAFSGLCSEGPAEKWEIVLNGERHIISARSTGCFGICTVLFDGEEVWSRTWDGREEGQCCVTTDLATYKHGNVTLQVCQEVLRRESGFFGTVLMLAIDGLDWKTGQKIVDIIIADRRWYFFTYGTIAASLFVVAVLIELAVGLHPIAATFIGGGVCTCTFFCTFAGYSWLRWSVKKDIGWPISQAEEKPRNAPKNPLDFL